MEKIILETGESLFINNNLKVFKGDEYNATDLVLVIEEGDKIPLYQYQANFIKFGEII